MIDFNAKKVCLVSLAMLLIGIASCGGGDDEEDDEDEVFDNDTDLTGYWTGTVTPDGRTAGSGVLFVGSDGKFAIESPHGLLIGTGDTSGNSFSANATGYAPPNGLFTSGIFSAAFSLNGSVPARVITSLSTLTGSYSSAVARESGTISFTYNQTISNRTASLAAVTGNYSAVVGGSTLSLVINNSVMTFNASTGCTGTGTIQVADAAHNYYSWTLTFGSTCPMIAGQTATGIATMPSTISFRMWGQGPSFPFAFLFIR